MAKGSWRVKVELLARGLWRMKVELWARGLWRVKVALLAKVSLESRGRTLGQFMESEGCRTGVLDSGSRTIYQEFLESGD